MTSSTIQVNQSNVGSQANSVSSAASYLEMKDLTTKDPDSTISAKENSLQAYYECQALIQSLGEAMDNEASNISDLGLDFKEYDEMLQGFWELGDR